jgi:hypothetical protein
MEAKRVSAMEFGEAEFSKPEFNFDDLVVTTRLVSDAQVSADIPTLPVMFKVSKTETAFGELGHLKHPKTGKELTKAQLMKLYPVGTQIIGAFDVYPKTPMMDKVKGKQMVTEGEKPALMWNRRIELVDMQERIKPVIHVVTGLDGIIGEIDEPAEAAEEAKEAVAGTPYLPE